MTHLLVSAAILLLAAPSFGQSSGGRLGFPQSSQSDGAGGYIPAETRSLWLDVLRTGFPSGPICQGPVSTCNAGDGSGCPAGFSCRCVPSCPTCPDCGLGVCMPDADPAEPPICEELREELAEDLEDLLERGARCRQDRDCAWLDTSTACAGSCGTFGHRRLVRRLARELRRVDERHCSDYDAEGCAVVTPACRPLRPVCERNRCTGVPVRP